MSQLQFTIVAQNDLNDIWEYIAKDSLTAASRFVDFIEGKCKKLVGFPGMGVSRPELASNLHSFPVGNYLIFYRPSKTGIEIIRILGCWQDIDESFFYSVT